MGKEDGKGLNLLSLRDFEERGIKIDRNWSGLQVLRVVARLATQKLEEEERIRKGKESKKPVIEAFGPWSAVHQGSSSTSKDDPGSRLAWVSDKNERGKTLKQPVMDMHSTKVKDPFENGSCPSSSGKINVREKALKQPVIKAVSEKKKGFVAASRGKLLGDAMKASFRTREDGDDERVPEYIIKQLNKFLNRSVSKRDNSEEKGSKSNKKVKRVRCVLPSVRTDLPHQFRARIDNLNGSKIEVVIQKYLFSTDISFHHRRLSIPASQIISKSFLTEEEKRDMDNGREMSVRLLDPSLQVRAMTLKRWVSLKEEVKPKSSFCYVLISEWSKVVEEHKLETGDLIQVWSFRMPGDELGLALVLVRRVGENDVHNIGGDPANGGQGTEEKDGGHGANGSDDQSPSSAFTGSTCTQVSTNQGNIHH